ncbi:Sugar fermentation stimulation protein A [Sporotomaculum syntrophicum]|uniref:Sugar fermentation stimulation protein homolog n=1 Tax=Sporotomaculum syntrophicum TaxID=182264 RepID=A0A9D3AZM3_9FIRM|nr:DNA/RNA nuclease SfsA [Sporotomaculum syntrophicum]KAF1086681.1 Sugar fermentation stimulation protein A [Sporotomaculum syntrophicum]
MCGLLLPSDLIEATFLARPNRFTALIDLAGREVAAHVPSTGRMRELLVPGAIVYLQPSNSWTRRTKFTLLLVKYQGIWVSIDSLLPNRLFYHMIMRGVLPEFKEFTSARREFRYRDGRIDFWLGSDHSQCLVEVKYVTLVENGEARFPDAPTKRGARHINELSLARSEGYRTAVIFIVQREDGVYFKPNDTSDPLFGQALRSAKHNGVEVYAFCCQVNKREITLKGQIPVKL